MASSVRYGEPKKLKKKGILSEAIVVSDRFVA